MAGSEPVTSPDQHKPGHRKTGRIGAIVVALVLVGMIFQATDVTGLEKLWLIGLALGLVAIVIGDAVLRRNGLRS